MSNDVLLSFLFFTHGLAGLLGPSNPDQRRRARGAGEPWLHQFFRNRQIFGTSKVYRKIFGLLLVVEIRFRDLSENL